LLLILKNLRRNKLRTVITCLAGMVLVFIVTMMWTVVYFLDVGDAPEAAGIVTVEGPPAAYPARS
jgi:ABC-type Na+ efflux pump permease subunit